MRVRLRGVLAWLLAALVLVVVVAFQIVTSLVLAALLTVGLVYELGSRLVRLVRPEKPIERGCLHCEVERRRFTNDQLEQYVNRRD